MKNLVFKLCLSSAMIGLAIPASMADNTIPRLADKPPPPNDQKVHQTDALKQSVPNAKLVERIEACLKEVEDPVEQARILWRLASIKHHQGHRQAGVEYFRQAIKALGKERILEPQALAPEWRNLVRVMADCGVTTDAINLVKQLLRKDDSKQVAEAVLLEILPILGRRGEGKQALDLADTLEPKATPENRYIAIAVGQSMGGHTADALETVKRLQNPQDKLLSLVGNGASKSIAQYQAEGGDLAGALQTLAAARRLIDQLPVEDQPLSRCILAVTHARIGDYQGALTLTKKIDNRIQQAQCVMHCGDAWAGLGHWQEVVPLVSGAEKPSWKCELLLGIALGQCMKHQNQLAKHTLDTALEYAELIADQDEGDEATCAQLAEAVFANIAITFAKAGFFSEATRVAQKHVHQPFGALCRIIEEQERVGDVPGALQTVARIKDRFVRADMLDIVALRQGANGKGAEALAWVDKLPSPFARAMALSGLVDGNLQFMRERCSIDKLRRRK